MPKSLPPADVAGIGLPALVAPGLSASARVMRQRLTRLAAGCAALSVAVGVVAASVAYAASGRASVSAVTGVSVVIAGCAPVLYQRRAFRVMLEQSLDRGAKEACAALSLELHSRVKNRARAIGDALTLPGATGPALAESKTRELVLEVEDLRRELVGLDLDRLNLPAVVRDVLDDLVPERLREGWLHVADFAYAGGLAVADGALLRVLLSDLVTNAARAGATAVTVGFSEEAGGLRLEVWDDCAECWDPDWLSGGSLSILAKAVERRRGSFEAKEVDRGHVVSASWSRETDEGLVGHRG